jgi:hypothetical protein
MGPARPSPATPPVALADLAPFRSVHQAGVIVIRRRTLARGGAYSAQVIAPHSWRKGWKQWKSRGWLPSEAAGYRPGTFRP